MAHIGTHSQAPGAKSIPAELRARQYHGTPDFALARLHENLEQSQSRGGVIPWGLQKRFGVSGLGDTCLDSATPGYEYLCSTPDVTIQPTDPNFDWAALAGVINVASTSMAKILAASNPGTYYKDPQGNVIYAQPTGQPNLPGVYGASGPYAGGGAQGSITSPIGSASFGGLSSSTVMMIAVVGLLAVMVMSGGRR